MKENLSKRNLVLLSLQHSFAMFGASIIIPILMGIDIGTAFLMNGIGTIFYIFYTKKKSPAFLGSSGAFLLPTILISKEYGLAYAIGGFVFIGLLGIVFSYIIKYKNKHFNNVNILNKILPPTSMGIIVALIGLDLIKYAVGGGKLGADLSLGSHQIIFLVTVLISVYGSIYFKGTYKCVALLIAIVVGYVLSVFYGLVDLSISQFNNIIYVPKFILPKFSIKPLMMMLPVIFVTISEHISHQMVTSSVIGKDLLKDPGVEKTMFADNLSTMVSGLVGGSPTTTYAENIGVMAITKIYDYRVLIGASIFSILFAFLSPVQTLVSSIPGVVIGGVSFVLYGIIAISGIRIIVDSKVDYSDSKNMMLSSIVLVVGLSNIKLNLFGITYQGMLLATLVAIFMGLTFIIIDKIKK